MRSYDVRRRCHKQLRKRHAPAYVYIIVPIFYCARSLACITMRIHMYVCVMCMPKLIPKQVKLMGSLVSLGYALYPIKPNEVVHVNQVK